MGSGKILFPALGLFCYQSRKGLGQIITGILPALPFPCLAPQSLDPVGSHEGYSFVAPLGSLPGCPGRVRPPSSGPPHPSSVSLSPSAPNTPQLEYLPTSLLDSSRQGYAFIFFCIPFPAEDACPSPKKTSIVESGRERGQSPSETHPYPPSLYPSNALCNLHNTIPSLDFLLQSDPSPTTRLYCSAPSPS